MKYRYEMHQHTVRCSGCGHADPETLVRTMKRDGYAGCVLTDHFYNGNSGIDRNLPWDQFCKAYEDAYLIAKKTGEELDFDVLFGIEENIGRGKEVLIYGITPEYIYSHPEMRVPSLRNIYVTAHEAGAVVIQAHPFRDRDYIPDAMEEVDHSFVDGYEVFNSCNNPEDNEKALARFRDSGKILTAGSDSHTEEFEGRSGIETDVRIRNEKQLALILKNRDYTLFGTE